MDFNSLTLKDINTGLCIIIGSLMGIGYFLNRSYRRKIKELKNIISDLDQTKESLSSQIKNLSQESLDIQEKLNSQLINHINTNRKSTSLLTTCPICFEDDARMMVVLPCGHVFACQDCLMNYPSHHCYICQAPVRRINRIYFLIETPISESKPELENSNINLDLPKKKLLLKKKSEKSRLYHNVA